MIPTNERHENANYISEIPNTLKGWDIPVLVCFSDKDIAIIMGATMFRIVFRAVR